MTPQSWFSGQCTEPWQKVTDRCRLVLFQLALCHSQLSRQPLGGSGERKGRYFQEASDYPFLSHSGAPVALPSIDAAFIVGVDPAPQPQTKHQGTSEAYRWGSAPGPE